MNQIYERIPKNFYLLNLNQNPTVLQRNIIKSQNLRQKAKLIQRTLMGNNQKKPFEKVEIFIEVQKSIYESGETIQGKVYLNALAEKLPYEKMTLGFYCRQTSLITASKETGCQYETSENMSYSTELTLHDFKKLQLTKGQYSFPFSIKLPGNLPTSFSLPGKSNVKEKDEKKIQIKYALKASLANNMIPNQNYGDLTKIHYLNIVRPFKNSFQPLSLKKKQYGSSCFCFGQFTTEISLYVDKNFLFSGDKFQINGQVDNMYGGKDLIALNCQLIEKDVVSNQKRLFYKEKERGVLHSVKEFLVKKGNTQSFSFSYKVPEYLEHSSSIGNYSAIIYLLRFQYQFKDTCDLNRSIDIPVHIQTRTPKIEVNIDSIPSSYQWNPSQQGSTELLMEREFVYDPLYPLERYRLDFEKLKIDVPSLQYFNKMSSNYPTKNFASRSNTQSQQNPYLLQANPDKQNTQKGIKSDGAEDMP